MGTVQSLLFSPTSGTHVASENPACPVGGEVHDSVPSFPHDGPNFSAGEDALQKGRHTKVSVSSAEPLQRCGSKKCRHKYPLRGRRELQIQLHFHPSHHSAQ